MYGKGEMHRGVAGRRLLLAEISNCTDDDDDDGNDVGTRRNLCANNGTIRSERRSNGKYDFEKEV